MKKRLFLLAAAFCLAGCAQPLGPGFDIERQDYELRLVPEAPARLQVRAIFRLRNVGNAALLALDVRLPDPASLGRKNLRIRINGQDVTPLNADASTATVVEIPFSTPWQMRERRELIVEYDLAPDAPGHAGVSVDEDSAHVRHYAWFPELVRPPVLFPTGGAPQKNRVSVHAPTGFQVLGAGRSRGTRRSGPGVEHRFERQHHEFDPFLIAGRYVEARFATPDGGVVFWTFEPLDPAAAARAAERIAGSHGAYVQAFGKIEKKREEVYVVETHARLTPRADGPDGPAGIGFPYGALLNSAALKLDLTSEAFLSLVEHELAHAWFGLTVQSSRASELLLSEALTEYASIVAAEKRDGESARRHRAALLLRWFDESCKRTPEKLLDELRPDDPWEQRVFAYNKGALFFLALEDEIGKEAMRKALARMVYAMRGRSDTNASDLRAAMEGESGKPLADFFRTWLLEKGIPDSFRSRYEVRIQ